MYDDINLPNLYREVGEVKTAVLGFIDEQRTHNIKADEASEKLATKLSDHDKEIESFKRIKRAFAWVLTTAVALAGGIIAKAIAATHGIN